MNQRAGAHRAWLNCSKQFAAFQAVVADRGTRFAQRNDLSVGRRVRVAEIAVAAATDDLAITNHDGADRNFPRFKRTLGRSKSFLHKQFVRFRVGRLGNNIHALGVPRVRVPTRLRVLRENVGDGNHHLAHAQIIAGALKTPKQQDYSLPTRQEVTAVLWVPRRQP